MKRGNDLARHMFKRRDFLKISGIWGGAMALGGLSQTTFSLAKGVYPTKKITWLIGLPPGGGTDTSSRAVAPFVERQLRDLSPNPDRVGVVITNLVGADGLRAVNKLYHSEPDGYTIMGANEKAFGWAIGGKLDFDVFKLTYIGRLASSGKVLVAHNKSNLHTWDDVVKASKKAPLDIGFAGVGSSTHMAAIFIIDATKIAARSVASSGTSANIAAVLRGDVSLALFPMDIIKSLVEAKEVRPILLFTDVGKKAYPRVPTVKDIGFPELMDTSNSIRYVVAPPNLPANTKKILQDILAKAMADKEFLALNDKVGLEMAPLFGTKFDQHVKNYYNFLKSKEKLIREYL